MRNLLLVGFAFLALGFAPAPFPKPDSSKDDMQKMRGVWDRLTCTYGSMPPVPKPVNDVVTISDGKITYGPSDTWVLTLGNLKGLKTFDISRAGQKTPGWVGVYELQGDTLRVCFTPVNQGRPKGIQPSKSGEHLQTFRRKK